LRKKWKIRDGQMMWRFSRLTVKSDFLKTQATELPTIKTEVIRYIILKAVYKYLRAE